MEFDRLKMLIDDEKFNKLKNKTVLILGLGGVGGSVAVNLARCGIRNFIIIDYDVIDITNINRQVIAYNSTIGLKKVDVIEKMLLDINKDIKVIKYQVFYEESNKDIIFQTKIDYIFDCCDAISSKKIIIKEAINRNILLITSMGTGNRLDPTKLIKKDIRDTSYDPIARKLRKWLKDEHIYNKIDVITSTEHPIKMKIRKPGSITFVPNAAGILMAYYAVEKMLGEEND